MSKLNFDNTYARLPSHWYQTVSVTPLKNTHLISFNAPLAQTLGLNPCEWAPSQLVDTFTTAQGPEGAEPLAMKYTGHQFGVYNAYAMSKRGVSDVALCGSCGVAMESFSVMAEQSDQDGSA